MLTEAKQYQVYTSVLLCQSSISDEYRGAFPERIIFMFANNNMLLFFWWVLSQNWSLMAGVFSIMRLYAIERGVCLRQFCSVVHFLFKLT